MEEPKFNNKIEDLEDQLWDIKQRLEYVESVLEIETEDDEDDYDPTLHPSMEDDHSGDDDYFDQDDPLKHTHCLLYTSPSPRDQRGSRIPASA